MARPNFAPENDTSGGHGRRKNRGACAQSPSIRRSQSKVGIDKLRSFTNFYTLDSSGDMGRSALTRGAVALSERGDPFVVPKNNWALFASRSNEK